MGGIGTRVQSVEAAEGIVGCRRLCLKNRTHCLAKSISNGLIVFLTRHLYSSARSSPVYKRPLFPSLAIIWPGEPHHAIRADSEYPLQYSLTLNHCLGNSLPFQSASADIWNCVLNHPPYFSLSCPLLLPPPPSSVASS